MLQWRNEMPEVGIRQELIKSTIEQVGTWIAEAGDYPASKSSGLLAMVLKDQAGLQFAVSFVDDVVRPEDIRIAARNLRRISANPPAFLPAGLQALVRIGGVFATVMPWPVVPIAKNFLRGMVGHLIVDASPGRLSPAIQRLRAEGFDVNVNLLGEAVLGLAEADNRLRGTMELLSNPDVDYISLKVSAAIAPHSPWAFDEAVAAISARLLPLFEYANACIPKKFINLDMEEYKDLALTIAVFKNLLERPQLSGLKAGIVLQAYLPDALGAMIELQDWAAKRVAAGGAPVKVRIVKGANLPMESIDSELHDWPLAVVESKRAADTNYKRIVAYSLNAERLRNIEVGIAGHNLFDIAFAKALMDQRKVSAGVSFEMLLGMAESQAKAVAKSVGAIRLYTPVVHPKDFEVAIAYLIRRLDESANQENFMSAVFELDKSEALMARETQRFIDSVAHLDDEFAPTNRVQNRLAGAEVAAPQASGTFHNTPDTDSATAGNRAWAAEIYRNVQALNLATPEAAAAIKPVESVEHLDQIMNQAMAAAKDWQALSPEERSTALHRVGHGLEANRANLIETMMVEAGKTIEQADPEVSEAVDFAHYYAEQCLALANIDGAKHKPHSLTLVTPPWNFPIAIPAGSTLAALAAGSAAVLKPAPQVNHCGALLSKIIIGAGLPAGLVQLAIIDEGHLGKEAISHPLVDQIVLTGSFETAKLFKSINPNAPLFAETSGKNAIIVTPSADYDLAVKDIVKSAFGHAGQKCSAASLLILVGSVGRSSRFANQLVDAARSLVVDYPTNPESQVGPLIEPASGKLLQGLTKLEAGEKWLLEPKQLDGTGRLWSPGIRDGIKFGSTSHLVEYFGPILSIYRAATLAEALQVQNAVDYGLTAGIFSLDQREIKFWQDNVQAGNLYVNRSITGAIVQRQPFGGWKKSVVGPTAKAGGPNYLIGFGSFESAPAVATGKPSERVAAFVESVSSVVPPEMLAALRRSASSDAEALATHFGMESDQSGLASEKNILRYVSRDEAHVRINADAQMFDAVRVLVAAVVMGAPVSVDPDSVALEAAKATGLATVEPETDWVETTKTVGGRVRLVGTLSQPLPVEIAVYNRAAVESGLVELQCHFREQAISVTNHRFGNPIR